LPECSDSLEMAQRVEEAAQVEARQPEDQPVGGVDAQARVGHRAEGHQHVAVAGPLGQPGLGPVHLGPVGQGGLVAVVAVGQHHLASRQRSLQALDGGPVLHPPEPVVHAVVGIGLGDGVALGQRADGGPAVALGVLEEPQHRREVGPHPAQDLQPLQARCRQGLLVGQDDPLGVVVEADRGQDRGAHAGAAVRAGEGLLQPVEGRTGILLQDAVRQPALPGAGGALEALAAGVAGAVGLEDDVDGVVGAAGRQLLALLGRDHVVGRRDEARQRLRPRGGIAKASEREHRRHGAMDARSRAWPAQALRRAAEGRRDATGEASGEPARQGAAPARRCDAGEAGPPPRSPVGWRGARQVA
jgi:hypothetical protein